LIKKPVSPVKHKSPAKKTKSPSESDSDESSFSESGSESGSSSSGSESSGSGSSSSFSSDDEEAKKKLNQRKMHLLALKQKLLDRKDKKMTVSEKVSYLKKQADKQIRNDRKIAEKSKSVKKIKRDRVEGGTPRVKKDKKKM
jgi:hypothetical protein